MSDAESSLAPGAPISVSDELVIIEAPHFVAGIIMRGDECIDAAPILRWAVGKDRRLLRRYFRQKKWIAVVCPGLRP